MAPLLLITPRRFADHRGWLSESYSRRSAAAQEIVEEFVQDNHSLSRLPGTLRGLHFQVPPHAQSKLVRCLRGAMIDYVVDLRRGSPTYGRWLSVELSAENGSQLYIPIGFAHAFLTLGPDCEVAYKVSDYYAPDCDRGIRYDDPDIAIAWPRLDAGFVLSPKDLDLPPLAEFDSPFTYDGNPMPVRLG